MGIILAVLVFGSIIFIHELGHFLLAKVNGIRVDEFSLGMGPRLLSIVKGETRYSLKLFPIGGSCVMGEDDVNDVGEGSFNSKSVWARISVVAAGAIFNFILAFVFAVIIIGYTGYDEPVISGVLPGYSAEAEGMQAGDKILRMNGKKINENINRIKAKTAKCLFILGVNKSFVFLCFFKKINKVKKNHMFENKEQSKEKSITTTSYMNNFF